MHFYLTEDQQFIRKAARELASKEIRPRAAELDKKAEFPWDNIKALAEYGYLGMTAPEEYGGMDADALSHTLVIEQVAWADASTAVVLEVHNSLVIEGFKRWGTLEQKEKYLPSLASGEVIGAYALTEPNAGSDAAGIETTAKKKGDKWVLNGRKVFITSGGIAGIYIVFAVTDKSLGKRGISAFIVEKEFEGVSFGPLEEKMGIKSSATCDVLFEDVEVPLENLLGNEGEGYKMALAALDSGRIGIGAQSLGLMQAALDASIKYAKERNQFGQPIANFQGIQWKLADMATDLEAARLLVYQAAFLYDEGLKTNKRYSKEISMAKLFASRAAMKHTIEAVQIHGGYGYIREYGVERLMRDAKVLEIYEGTSEIQKLVIASSLLQES